MFRSPLTLFKQSQKMCRIAHRRRRWAEYDYHLSKRLDGQIIHQKICIIHIYIVQCRNTSQYGPIWTSRDNIFFFVNDAEENGTHI